MDPIVFGPVISLIVVALIICCHHGYSHSLNENDHAREESCIECCYMQPSDLKNHECWVVCLFFIAVTWLAASYAFTRIYS